jgi:hypothetical protein
VTSRRFVVAALIVCAASRAVHGQTSSATGQPPLTIRPRSTAPPVPGPERVRLVVNGGLHWSPGTFAQDFAISTNVEAMPIATRLRIGTAGFFEAGARVRVSRAVSLGAVGFVGAGSADGTVDAKVPHPFYFIQPRPVSGDIAGLDHRERGVHVELAYPVTVKPGREVTLFGGPSFISVRQGLVSDVSYSESYPYDSATFSSASVIIAHKTVPGLHAGMDVTWRLNRSLRAGGLVRYSYAHLALSSGDGNDVTMRAGGIRVGGSLRVLLQKRAPRRR